jgi:hypothetical protein
MCLRHLKHDHRLPWVLECELWPTKTSGVLNSTEDLEGKVPMMLLLTD